MKHIRLYEDYKDELGAFARDIFGLTSRIVVKNTLMWEMGKWIMEGPSEHKKEAEEISKRIEDAIWDAKVEWEKLEDNEESEGDEFEYQQRKIENGIPEEQAALARIGWRIHWEEENTEDY
jgi:hypothetical protein